MNYDDISRRVFARLQSPAEDANPREYVVPEPTLEQLLDWFEYQRIGDKLDAEQRELENPTPPRPNRSMQWIFTQADEARRLVAILDDLRADGVIDEATHAKLTTVAPHSDAGQGPEDLKKRIARWLPQCDSNIKHPATGATVGLFYVLRPDNTRRWLLAEDKRWLEYQWHELGLIGQDRWQTPRVMA